MSDDKKRAIEAIRKVAEAKIAPYTKKAAKALEKGARKKIKELGMNPKDVEKALIAAEMVRSGKVEGSIKIGKNTRLKAEVDAKKKALKLKLNHKLGKNTNLSGEYDSGSKSGRVGFTHNF